MENYKLKYKPFGSISVLIEWPQKIDIEIIKDINQFRTALQYNMNGLILDTVPAYNSLTVFFDTSKIKYKSAVNRIKEIYNIKNKEPISNSKIWKIPVCYDDEFGIDLEEISITKKITKQEIIRIHSDIIYDLYFIGFLPGFLYLGGLSEKIQINRKPIPRKKINKGSVGIAGNQTGIYPRASPAGWNIIGNSPINIFDVETNPPCFASSGDKIQFIPIDKKKHFEIKEEVKNGNYLIQSKTYG